MPQPLVIVSKEFESACVKAISKWGRDEQLVHTMAEATELVAAIGRHYQGRDPELEEVTQEAADSLIMALQIRELVGHERFDAMLRLKFNKFVSKMEKVIAGEQYD